MTDQSNSADIRQPGPPGWVKSVLLSIPMLLLTALMFSGSGVGGADTVHRVATWVTFLFLNTLFFLMVKTGKTDRYRAIFYVTFAVAFVITFTSELIAVRGSNQLTTEDVLNGETPFCHLVIPMTLITAAFKKTIIFPGSLVTGFAAIMAMVSIWIGATLAVGRGWCSWICFYGGLDDGFSRLRRKPVIRNIAHKWTYLPHAVLIGGALTAALTLSPTYCEWLCPFKAVTEYEKITSVKILIQTFIFGSLFAGLVVVLPILTKRRTQCALLCPFASFQSFFNKTNVFDVRIDRDKCTDCGQCIKTCPTLSMDEDSVTKGKTRISCTKCGRCVDKCPKKAITFHIRGTPVQTGRQAARLLFLYPAYLFGTTIAAGSFIGALTRALNLVL
jgi:ferredoxin-type protein NapH